MSALSKSGGCLSCVEQLPGRDCRASERGCGHHCNCSWEQDECCWCGCIFGAGGVIGQRVIHLPSGRKGQAIFPVGDRAMVAWDGGYESLVDHDELRTSPLGERV